MKKTDNNADILINRTMIKVRFSEVDSMNIVWHGVYLKYFEDGRESFGLEYPGLGYGDIMKSGYMTPIVDISLQYKSPLKYNDRAVIETRFINTETAKICFEYEIRRELDNKIVALGNSTQVFTDHDGIDRKSVV